MHYLRVTLAFGCDNIGHRRIGHRNKPTFHLDLFFFFFITPVIIAQTNNYIRQRNDQIFTSKMSLRQENLEELRMILFEMFAVHLKTGCIFL